jgi:hypothetical protein
MKHDRRVIGVAHLDAGMRIYLVGDREKNCVRMTSAVAARYAPAILRCMDRAYLVAGTGVSFMGNDLWSRYREFE